MIGPDDPRFVGLVEMLGRTGAKEFRIRFWEDEDEPIVWVAQARWKPGGWQVAGALGPYEAVMRLAESVLDGGTCTHCQRPTAVDDKPADPLILATEALVCWYRWDPELKTFRRGCEGHAA